MDAASRMAEPPNQCPGLIAARRPKAGMAPGFSVDGLADTRNRCVVVPTERRGTDPAVAAATDVKDMPR